MGDRLSLNSDGGERLVPARGRVAVAFGAFALGLIAACEVVQVASMWWFVACVVAVCIAAVGRGWVCRAALALAMMLGAGGWYSYRVQEVPTESLARVLSAADANHGLILTVEGMVLGEAERVLPAASVFAKFRHESVSWRFAFDVHRLVVEGEEREASGRLWVRVAGEERPRVRGGDSVRLTGVAREISGPLNPGQVDARPGAAQSGFVGSLSLSSNALIVEDVGTIEGWDHLYAAFLRLRGAALVRARGVLDAAFAGRGDDESRALVAGLLLGDVDDASGRSVYDAFTRLGLAHVLSISGFHLAVLASVTLFLVRLTGDRGWVEPTIVGVIVVGYSMMLPAQSPILRSAAMVLMMLIAEACGRRYDRLTILMWIAILLLVWRPADLWNLGYQLSVGLTALLMWIGEAWHWRMFLPPVKTDVVVREGAGQWVWRHVKGAWSSAILCFGASVPLVMYRTGVLSVLGVVATLVVTPIVVVVLWVGYVLLFVGVIAPMAAEWAGGVLRFFAHAAIGVTRALDGVPMSSVRLPTVSWAWTLVATVVLLALFRSGRKLQARSWGAIAAIVLWLGVEWAGSAGLSWSVAVRLDSLAVGDGSCHIVRSGSDTLVWDCGTLSAGMDGVRLRRALRAIGVWRATTAVVTHPDIDHFGSMPELVPLLGIRTVLLGERFVTQAKEEPEGPAAAFLGEMARLGVKVRVVSAGDIFEFGRGKLEFVSPPMGAAWARDNEHSLVAVVTAREGVKGGGWGLSGYDVGRLLLTGDVQGEGLRWLAEQRPELRADVLEVPHHGSALADSVMWVHALRPKVTVQSTGPSRAGDARWAQLRSEIAWYTTCVDGAAWAEIGVDGSVRSGAVKRMDARSP